MYELSVAKPTDAALVLQNIISAES